MRLRATMVKAYWGMTINHLKNRVPLLDVIEVNDFDEGLVLGEVKENEIWVTRTHYTDKNTEGGSFSQIAFQIIDYKGCNYEKSNVKNGLELYLVTSEYDELNEDNQLIYNEEADLWFQYAKVRAASKKWKEHGYKSIFDTPSIGMANSGSSYVVVIDKKDNKIIYKSPKVLFLPSSMTFEEYGQMIFDLIYLKDQLVKDKKSKVGLGMIEEYPISIIEDGILRLKKVLQTINKNPNKALINQYQYKKIKDNEKQSSKSLFKKYIYPYKSKQKVMVHKETSNVYENKIIKLSLTRLLRKIEYYMKHIDSIAKPNLEIIQSSIKEESNKLEQYVKIVKKKTIKEIETEYNNVKEKEDNFLKMLEPKQIENKYIMDTMEIRLHLIKKEDDIIDISIDSSKLETTFLSTYDKGKFSWDLSFNYEMYDEVLGGWKAANTGNQQHLIDKSILKNKDIRKHLFLLDELSKLKKNKKLIIEGQVILPKKSSTKDDPLRVGIEVSRTGDSYPKHEIVLIDLFKINGHNFDNFCKSLREDQAINLFYKYDVTMQDIDDVIIPFQKLKNQLAKKQKSQKDLISQKEKLIKLYNNVNDIVKLEFLKDVKEENIIIRPTPTFIKDKYYKQVWDVINNMDKEVLFLDESLDGKIINLKKTCDIYEVWCYFKMLHLLIYQIGWKVEDESIKEKLDDIFNNSSKNDLPNGFYISLSHHTYEGDEVKLRFHYNPTIQKLRPDYYFEFTTPLENVNIYLDAKYRDYESQGQFQYIEDIEEIAYEKYIGKFENTNSKASASFIIHCDPKIKYTNFGGFYDKNLYTFKNSVLINSPSHKYGAFVFKPSNQQNFILWFKMIMEYILPYYSTCWQCGESEDIEVYSRSTKGGYPKFHIYCKKCDSFWVKSHCRSQGHKLVKHITSYHYRNPEKDDIWWVKCPKCSNGDLNVNSLNFEWFGDIFSSSQGISFSLDDDTPF